jgi:hypothetical protein
MSVKNNQDFIDILTDKEKIVFEMREDRKTYSEIGKAIGRSASHSQQISKNIQRKLKSFNEDPCGKVILSVRARNAIANLMSGMDYTKDDIKTLIESEYHSRGYSLLAIKNCGRKTFNEICKWAGVKNHR